MTSMVKSANSGLKTHLGYPRHFQRKPHRDFYDALPALQLPPDSLMHLHGATEQHENPTLVQPLEHGALSWFFFIDNHMNTLSFRKIDILYHHDRAMTGHESLNIIKTMLRELNRIFLVRQSLFPV